MAKNHTPVQLSECQNDNLIQTTPVPDGGTFCLDVPVKELYHARDSLNLYSHDPVIIL